MGKGIELARQDAPMHAAVLDDLKDQLLLVLMKRLGGSVDIPVSEVDDTGNDTLSFAINDGVFQFRMGKKS
jgi:hypothetical protein